ncbi:hypothetical protein ACFWVB_02635 [Streptomyces microflavus]|uniref:hypothetical protein n=1 Tax=Streptomyces microflavus TaxID=1919 RepID=UPI003669D9C4
MKRPAQHRRLKDDLRDSVAENASLATIRDMLLAEGAEHLYVSARIVWLRCLLDRRTDELLAGTWPAPTDPEQPDPAPDLCPQNLYGDKAVPQPHHYPPGSTECVFCADDRTYVFNADSVNHMSKHAHDGQGRTLCPRRFRANPPMPADWSSRLPLCGGCRDVLTGQVAV